MRAPGTPLRNSLQTSRTEVTTPTSGSGYSSTDHQVLSELRRVRETATTSMSPPRKRRRLLSMPGKYMKDAYFKGIQWTRTFVSGPLDPVHNKFKFYCMLCKTNVSIYSKGAREILRTIGQKAIREEIKSGGMSTYRKPMKSLESSFTTLEEGTVTS